jgi:hypothetical protein
MIELKITCIMCQKVHFINVSPEALNNYKNGMHVQTAFPELEPWKREMLLSRICNTCWDELFPEEDE